VVGDFTGRGAARIRNQLVRALARSDLELVARSDLDAEASRQGVDLGEPEGMSAAAGALGIRALIDGAVSRRGRSWTLRVTVYDAATGEEVADETFRGRTSGRLARTVRAQGRERLDPALERTSVPAPPEAPDEEEEDDLDDEDVSDIDEDDDDEPSFDRDDGDRPTALDLAIYGRVFHRQLEYNDDIYGLLRGYTLPLGPAIEVTGRWYPGAHFTSGFGAHLGLEFAYERAFGIDSVRSDTEGDDETFPTRSQDWFVGVRGRIPFGAHNASVGLGYGSHIFVIDPSGPAVEGRSNLPEIPRTEYDYVRIHAEARLAIVGGLRFTLGGGYRVVLSPGGIQDEVWFPASDVGGVELDAMLGYLLDNGLEIRLGFDWRRYFYTMNVEVTSPWIAGGALDQYFGGSLGLAWRY
jgi:hypothetical protein